jgi:hypothetical protein
MTKTNVHIFIGRFENRKDATSYTEGQWEPEPDSTVTDEEYNKWEERNPRWKMRDDLNCYIDSDFIETITDEIKLKYFESLVEDNRLAKQYSKLLSIEESALILIFDLALDESEKNIEMKSTDKMEYIGRFPTVI